MDCKKLLRIVHRLKKKKKNKYRREIENKRKKKSLLNWFPNLIAH